MARKWEDLKKELLAPEDLATVEQDVKEELARINFAELRKRASITQEQLALALNMSQGDVSKMERRDDVLVSTALKYLGAIGARLEVVMGNKRIPIEASLRHAKERQSRARASRS